MTILSQYPDIGNGLSEGFNCFFGLLKDGGCFYNPLSASPMFTLGGAIASFGLIFAVYQLRKPEWEIVLRIRPKWQTNIFWWFSGLGLVFVFLGALVSQVPIFWLSAPFNYPIFYEIIGYIFFILSPSSLLFFATRTKGLFTEKTAERFYGVLISETSRLNETSLKSVFRVFALNLEEICASASKRKIKRRWAYKDDEDDVLNKTELQSEYAMAILDVFLGDELVSEQIATKRLDILRYILHLFSKYKLDTSNVGQGINHIVNELFANNKSYLYKQLENRGLALPSNIYKMLFESPTLLSNFNFFDQFILRLYRFEKNSEQQTRTMIKAVESALVTYMHPETEEYIRTENITSGIERLTDIFEGAARQYSDEIKNLNEGYHWQTSSYSSMNAVAHFFGHGYPYLYNIKLSDHWGQKTDEEKKAEEEAEQAFYSKEEINKSIAKGIVKSLAALSGIEKADYEMWHILLDLIHGIEYYEKTTEVIRIEVLKQVWSKITENIKRRHFPAITQPYLHYFGFMLASKASRDRTYTGWKNDEVERVRRLLYVDLKPLILKNTEMVNKEKMEDVLLPAPLNYDRERDIFTYQFGFGEGEVVDIDAPPENAGSALEKLPNDE